MVGDSLDGVSSIVGAMNLTASSQTPSNNFLMSFGSYDIHVEVTSTARTINDYYKYRHLYGSPLGEIRTLSTLQGYTEITNIHLEGEGFSTATEEEIAKIYNDLAQGFII